MLSAEHKGERLKFERTLRQAIADALHAEVAHELPACCESLGLAPGTGDEAFASKRSYVKKRLQSFNESALLEIGQKVLELHDNTALRDLVSERLLPMDQRLSEITRRKVLKVLDTLHELYGDLGRAGMQERLDTLAPSWSRPSDSGAFLKSFADDFVQHYLRNDDWSHASLLEQCGALTCAHDRFVGLINSVLSPEARTGDEQESLARDLDEILKPDGYAVMQTGSISGHAVYEVVRHQNGVGGQAKNLIFASIGEKPDIVLRDAINNDLQIVRNAQLCLVYDRPLSPSLGLTWLALAEWWQARESLPDIETARRQLGERLMQSLPVNSPGEHALFKTYFREFSPRLGDRLPALLPQVYLHYDPITMKQRGPDLALSRQRMDFLLLLPDRVRVVLEVDGQHHYAVEGRPSPERYAQMIREDRELRLKGYDLYRFGGAEFQDSGAGTPPALVGQESARTVKNFFERLFARYGLTL